jgi:acetyltransferase-like isoleucine patch superfamily enzyme
MNRTPAFVIAFIITGVFRAVVFPFVAIILKWIIIFKYRAGVYPMFGCYYLRWWFVNMIHYICGRGFFLWHPALLRTYYRLLGAHVGAGANIHEHATITEPDLISIGANSCIDDCEMKPFHMDHGCMLLEPIHVGDDCRVCTKATLAPGAALRDGSTLSPGSASYDLASMKKEYGNYCRRAFKVPSLYLRLCFGYPLILGAHLMKWVPVLLLLISMVDSGWYEDNVLTNITSVFMWFVHWKRIVYYLALRTTRAIISPWVYFFTCLFIKWVVIGKFRPGPRNRSDWNILRHWLMEQLLPGKDLGETTPMVGTHYEVVSQMYRWLGAKVGQRVYWPGSGLQIVEFDLLTVEDDVVFGSRSVIITCDANEGRYVTLHKACMLADRCVVLPGVTIHMGAVLGSGSLAAKKP